MVTVDEPTKSDLEIVEEDMIKMLKGKLADGSIKAMESKLLLDLMERKDIGTVRRGKTPVDLDDGLPFQSDTLISE